MPDGANGVRDLAPHHHARRGINPLDSLSIAALLRVAVLIQRIPAPLEKHFSFNAYLPPSFEISYPFNAYLPPSFYKKFSY